MRKIKLSDVYHYIVGNIRYHLYYKGLSFILPDHIKEQFEFRLQVMDNECYTQGSCKICGCRTTALQMANKSCDKPCYPPFMNKKTWHSFKLGASFIDKKNNTWGIKSISDGVSVRYKLMLNDKFIAYGIF